MGPLSDSIWERDWRAVSRTIGSESESAISFNRRIEERSRRRPMARIEATRTVQFRSLRKLWRSGTTEGSLKRPKARMAAFFTSRSGLFVSAKMSGSAHFSGVRRERKGWRFSRRRPGPRAIRAGGFGPFLPRPGPESEGSPTEPRYSRREQADAGCLPDWQGARSHPRQNLERRQTNIGRLITQSKENMLAHLR